MTPKNSSNLLQTQKKSGTLKNLASDPALSHPQTHPQHFAIFASPSHVAPAARRKGDGFQGPEDWRDARWPRSPPLTTQEVGENPTKNGGKHGKRLQSRRPITFFQVISMNRSDQLETLSFKHCSRSDLLKS